MKTLPVGPSEEGENQHEKYILMLNAWISSILSIFLNEEWRRIIKTIKRSLQKKVYWWSDTEVKSTIEM